MADHARVRKIEAELAEKAFDQLRTLGTDAGRLDFAKCVIYS